MKYRINTGINLRQVGTQYMVYDEGNSQVHIVNQLAGEILDLIKQGKSIEDIIEILLEKYDGVDRETLSSDMDEILANFNELDLLKVV